MGKYRDQLNNVKKQDSTPQALRAKIEVRQRVLDAIGADQAHVFDAYAGSGGMHAAVWNRAASCVGCDRLFYRDDRLAYVIDNLRLMRTIDLSAFNIFDFDAYGSPWDPLYVLSRLRPVAPGRRVGIVITEGTEMKLKMGSLPRTLATLAGLSPDQPGAGLGETQEKIITRAVQGIAKTMHATIVQRWQAHGKDSSRMIYGGMVLEGVGEAPEAPAGPVEEPAPAQTPPRRRRRQP